MSPKLSASVSTGIDSHCQHISPKGQRCHMLIDQHHRPSNGAARPTLCAYHADRLRATVPAVDPEVLADELLTDINSFTTADEVNLFLGNLVRQLARKRIAGRRQRSSELASLGNQQSTSAAPEPATNDPQRAA